MKYFEIKVKYDSINPNSGKECKMRESILVDALSFTEAEARIHKWVEELKLPNFTILNINPINIDNLLYKEGFDNYFFLYTVNMVTIDEKTGRESKGKTKFLINANDVEHSRTILNEELKNFCVNTSIHSMKETRIVEYLPYNNELKN